MINEEKISVSIIIPAKNEGKYIRTCLNSIKLMDYANAEVEIILVDNGSTDETVETAKEMGAIVYIEPTLTVAGLRNFGVKKATGEIVAFIDADCEVVHDWLRNAITHFKIQEIACVGAAAEAPKDGTWVQRIWSLFLTRNKGVYDAEWLNSMNMLVLKSAFEEVGGFDESLVTCEDVDLCYRLKNKYRIISDTSIRVIHHGEARNLREFYRKELWRGTSNIKGLLRHGIVLKELPSVALPVYYLLVLLTSIPITVYCLASGSYLFIFMLLILFFAPSIAFAIWIGKQIQNTKYSLHFCLLFTVYSVARAISLVAPLKR